MRRLARIVLPGIALPVLATTTLAACGSSSRTSSSTSSSTASSTAGTTSAGVTSGGASPTGALATGHDCETVVAQTLGAVAGRIYDAALHGNVVGQAVHRVESSRALAAAVSANDATAADAALRSLLAGQIAAVRVTKGGKVLAEAGSGDAIAPVSGAIAGTDARFVLSTQAAQSYLKVAKQITGAEVVLYRPGGRLAGTVAGPPLASVRRDGKLVYRGRSYRVSTIAAGEYPSGSLRIALLVPRDEVSCRGGGAQTQVATLGHVGERIYSEEADSPTVRATLRRIEADAGFQQAVAARDTVAIRAAIVRFFGEHIHVVRVRVYAVDASGAQRFLYDLGGPYVLAPVHGVVRSAGKLVGRFSYAIQDDAGYLRLARLFTGAEVLMRVGTKQVMGTLQRGPASVPDRGALTYGGKTYQAYSFTGEAFPSGALRISLLIPKG